MLAFDSCGFLCCLCVQDEPPFGSATTLYRGPVRHTKVRRQLQWLFALVQAVTHGRSVDSQNQSLVPCLFCTVDQLLCDTPRAHKVQLEPRSGIICITGRQSLGNILQ